MWRSVLVPITILSVCGSLQAAEPADPARGLRTNVFYLPQKEQEVTPYQREMCRLDVHYPKNAKGFATVVWIHGGGLSSGSRAIGGKADACNKQFCEPVRDRGFAVVSIDYRLYPKATCPAFLEDAAAGVAWTFRNIGELGGDPDKIFVAGGSAGAYLASMIGMDKRWLRDCGIDADRIAGLIPVSGHTITHFAIRKEHGIPETRPVIDQFAPLYHVRADAPPVLLLTGDRELDMLGRYEENAYFMRMLKVAGHKDVTLFEMQGLNHGTVNYPAFLPAVEWMNKVLARRGQAKAPAAR
jgi:acetyl esterase/lipase